MRSLNQELLAATMFVDRAKTVRYSKAASEGKEAEAFTLRTYLSFILDLPVRDKPITPSRLNNINRIISAINADGKLEEEQFSFLTSFIDDVRIDLPVVYMQVRELIDTAQQG